MFSLEALLPLIFPATSVSAQLYETRVMAQAQKGQFKKKEFPSSPVIKWSAQRHFAVRMEALL